MTCSGSSNTHEISTAAHERALALGEMSLVQEAPQDHVQREDIHGSPDVEPREKADGTMPGIGRAGREKQGSCLEKARVIGYR